MLSSLSRSSFIRNKTKNYFIFSESRWLIFFSYFTFLQNDFLGFNLSSFCSHSLSASVFSFIPHPWNKCDLWELHARTLISFCDGAFHKWQNGDKEWHEGWELTRCPCDIFAHVDVRGKTPWRVFPARHLSWGTAERSKFNSLYRSECSAPPLSSAGWLKCAADYEETF